MEALQGAQASFRKGGGTPPGVTEDFRAGCAFWGTRRAIGNRPYDGAENPVGAHSVRPPFAAPGALGMFCGTQWAASPTGFCAPPHS